MRKKISDSFIRRADAVVWKVVDGKVILLNLNDGGYFDVNPVGFAVWKLCDGKKTLSQIVLRTSREFGVDEKRAERDTLNFVLKLKQRRLIELVSCPTPATARS